MKTSGTDRSHLCAQASQKLRTSGILRSMGMISLLMITLLLGIADVRSACAVESPPGYALTYLGNGSPVAINNHGTVVGAKLNSIYYSPLVSSNGSPWAPLPVPTGAQSVFPTDVNDNDVIVGVSYTNWVASAVRWKPAGGGSYTVEVLPFLPGSSSSYATAINNLGQIVGTRSAMGYTPQGTGWLYSDTLGLVDLFATYGLAVIPTDINDSGKILAGIELLDLNARNVTIIGGGPASYNPVTAVAINNSGMMAGYAALRSSSLNILSVFRHDGIASWNFIAGSSQYTTASSINSLGDIGYGEQGAGISFIGLGVYALNSLLDTSVTSAGWAITGNGVKVNDQRVVATLGRNTLTGQTGGVLLTPVGTVVPPQLQPPTLIATPSSGTAPLTVNFNRSVTTDPHGPIISQVTLNYGDNSPGVSGTIDFGDGTSTFTLNQNSSHIYQLPGAYNATLTVFYTDNTSVSTTATIIVSPGIIPAQPPAITATPVSGTAPLAVTFTSSATSASNGPLINSYSINYGDGTNNQFILNAGNSTTTFTGSSSHTYNAAGTYTATLTVTYSNATSATATTTITVNPVVVTPAMKSTAISLSASLQRSRVNVTGTVTVKDSNGRAIPGAVVSSTWAIPGGGAVRQSSTTSSTGIARFSTIGSRGTYTLKVGGISKAGYSFDSANSVLSRSITR